MIEFVSNLGLQRYEIRKKTAPSPGSQNNPQSLGLESNCALKTQIVNSFHATSSHYHTSTTALVENGWRDSLSAVHDQILSMNDRSKDHVV